VCRNVNWKRGSSPVSGEEKKSSNKGPENKDGTRSHVVESNFKEGKMLQYQKTNQVQPETQRGKDQRISGRRSSAFKMVFRYKTWNKILHPTIGRAYRAADQ